MRITVINFFRELTTNSSSVLTYASVMVTLPKYIYVHSQQTVSFILDRVSRWSDQNYDRITMLGRVFIMKIKEQKAMEINGFSDIQVKRSTLFLLVFRRLESTLRSRLLFRLKLLPAVYSALARFFIVLLPFFINFDLFFFLDLFLTLPFPFFHVSLL